MDVCTGCLGISGCSDRFLTVEKSFCASHHQRTVFLCALLVAVGLSLHDRFFKPVQPLHFSRGYVWLPLFLRGLPALLDPVWSPESVSDVTNCSVCGLFLVTDNLVFRAVHSWRQYHRKDRFHLDVHDRVLLSELCEN